MIKCLDSTSNLIIFYRIFAPKCNACGEGITPVEGTSDTVRVVAMEKDFHVDCYVCEVGFHVISELTIDIRILFSWYYESRSPKL